jgi:quinol monooxygenase YgiN
MPSPFLRLLVPGLAVAAMVAAAPVGAADEPHAGLYCVTYIEVAPASHGDGARILQQVAASSRAAAGNLRFEVLQRIDRPNQFNILEAWADEAARSASNAAPYYKQFRDALQPLLIAGYDERPSVPLVVGPLSAGNAAGGRAIYAVTHADFIPPKKDDGIAALKDLAAASPKDAGNVRFEVWQQASRANHLTLVEIWRDEGALDEHEIAKHTVDFRNAILPMSGALFDQRLYRALP